MKYRHEMVDGALHVHVPNGVDVGKDKRCGPGMDAMEEVLRLGKKAKVSTVEVFYNNVNEWRLSLEEGNRWRFENVHKRHRVASREKA